MSWPGCTTDNTAKANGTMLYCYPISLDKLNGLGKLNHEEKMSLSETSI
jgi:hypothetical protein